MEPGRRLVEDIERLSGGPARKLLGELDALRLAARERGRRLPDLDIAKAHTLQRHKLVADRRDGVEERRPLVDGHIKNAGYRFVLKENLQRLSIVSETAANIAANIHFGQEMHLDLDQSVALAGLAAPALDVEGEAAGLVAARSRLGQAGEPLADRREGAGVGRRVRARRGPIGDWSMSITLSRYSMPSMSSCSPGWARAPCRRRASALYSVSMISVDLPLPDTPVIQHSVPSGISAVMLLRLFSRAPLSLRRRPWRGARRVAGMGISRIRVKYCPVRLCGWP